MWYEIIRGLDHNMWMIFWVYILPQTPVLLRACLPSGWFWMIWVVRCSSYVHHMFVGCRLFIGCSSVVLRWDTRDHVIGPCGRLCLYRCQRPAVGVSTSGRRKRVGQTCLDRWLTDVGHVESLDHIGSLVKVEQNLTTCSCLHVHVKQSSAVVILRMWATILSRLNWLNVLFLRHNSDSWGTLMLFASTWTLEATTLRETRASWPMCQAGTSETHQTLKGFMKSVRSKRNKRNHPFLRLFMTFLYLLADLGRSWQASLRLMPSFIPRHRTPSTWPVTAAAIPLRSSWHKEIARRKRLVPKKHGKKRLSSVDMCQKHVLSAKQLPIPMTWRKASQNPRATLQSAGWAAWCCSCHFPNLSHFRSSDSVRWFALVRRAASFCVRRNLFGMDRTFGRAEYASRAALHALFGFGWSSLDGIWVPHGAAVLRFEVQVIFQIFQKSWVKHDLKIWT